MAVRRTPDQLAEKRAKAVLLTPFQLARVRARCPSLRVLQTYIELNDDEARDAAVVDLTLPPTLTTLEVDITYNFHMQARCDAQREKLLRAMVAGLPQLETLVLLRVFSSTSLAPLQQLPRLTDLQVTLVENFLQDSLANGLRRLPHLHRIVLLQWEPYDDHIFPLAASALGLLLAEPYHQLQWRDIGRVELNDKTTSLLQRLPSLTRLDGVVKRNSVSSFQFLCLLPALTSLSLSFEDVGCSYNFQSLGKVAEQGGLVKLTQLRLYHSVGDADMLRAVLQGTPQLRDLELFNCDNISSLDGVLDGVRSTLERLSLSNAVELDSTLSSAYDWQIATENMQHIVRCQQLRELALIGVLPLGTFARQPLWQRPCAVLPALERFQYVAPLSVRY